jgi:hypothetical protein
MRLRRVAAQFRLLVCSKASAQRQIINSFTIAAPRGVQVSDGFLKEIRIEALGLGKF